MIWSRARLLLGSLLAVASIVDPELEAQAEEARPVQIEVINYRGWPNTYRLSNARIEVSVVTDVGPRIIDLRLAGGENLLQEREGIGSSGEPTYQFRGGWRLWIAPERKETTYELDNSPCQVERIGADGIRVIGPPQQGAGIQKIVEARLSAGEAQLRLTSRIKNISAAPITYAGWSLPVLRRGGRAFIPLDVGPLTAFDSTRKIILWSYARFDDSRYRWGDRVIEIDHRGVRGSAGEIPGRRPDESKIGVDSAQGWSAYLLDKTLFVKRFAHQPGDYPDGGSTIEVYSNKDFLELEHLGPLTALAPGAEIVLEEQWSLFGDVSIPEDSAAALAALEPYLSK